MKLDSSFYGEGARVSISSCKLLDDWLLLIDFVLISCCKLLNDGLLLIDFVLISSIYLALLICGRLCLKHWMASHLIFRRYVGLKLSKMLLFDFVCMASWC